MKFLGKLIIVVAIIAAIFLFFRSKSSTTTAYVTQKARYTDILEKVTATGQINPISTVNIGSQVSGTISEIYVDYNSVVKKDQLLAQIDPAMFQATVDKSRANLEVAKAQVKVSENNIIYYKKDLERKKKLNASQYTSVKDLDLAEKEYKNALAQLDLQKATVQQAEAQLESAETELRYTRIVSPIDGIVVSKEVEVGQTVAASFQTPTLFYVAEDLEKMQIETSVVEADIAKVNVGQKVEFSVDSFPDEIFEGVVTQVRNKAITTSNVVTYQVIIEVNNKDLKLKPGMTANVEIITADKKGVLTVPNKALRFYVTDEDGKIQRYKDKGVWVLKNGKPERIAVSVGISDDENTEIKGETLKDGDNVIVEQGNMEEKVRAMRMRMPR
ncbi:MAG: efflux RND transporter periplasmic adaptor subunit [Alphaproteobacteria bacterium]|nr:efflux RND transporter periplasmic adaptor subunit [Alphaproteobacteria bacterium]